MIKKQYEIEREGQIDFFNNYQIPYKDDNSILVDNTDGVYNGVLLEFKLNINNPNSVLKQAIKYLSSMRIKGKSVPATILLIDLNNTMAYKYNSMEYIKDIEKVYIGSASKDNDNFIAKKPSQKYDYSIAEQANKLKKILIKENKTINEKYISINIDENCIVGWAERYYRENPTASKGEFLGDENGVSVKITGEIRKPRYFKGLINPYRGKTNEKFKYLMDCLNDRLSKKKLGAFYTPKLYAEKASDLVLKAIDRIPKGNDYVIIDRCAGTGNLQEALMGKYDKKGDEIISHCIVSTYEYYEYKVLQERIGNKVREIIPPTEGNVEYANGKILNADAMSKEFINNPIIKQYIDNPKCTIIMFENPPYRDDTSGMGKIKASNNDRDSFVLREMIKEKKKANEIANRFIWSAFKYYLRQPTDSYIVFSPIKYWKSDKIIDKKLIEGYIFNKKYFHASSESATICAYWSNEKEIKNEYNLKVFDIKDNEIKFIKKQKMQKVYQEISKIFDKTKNENDIKTNWTCSSDGSFKISKKENGILNDNILGYFVGRGFGLSNPNFNFNLLRLTFYDTHGFHLRKENYKKYLPLLAIKHHLMFERKWYEIEFIMCSADNGLEYIKDKDFLKKCFIFANLNYYNKCKSLLLPNGKILKNELCFDNNTICSEDLKKIKLNEEETKLISLWNEILKKAKETKEYNPDFTYGVYQIKKELNTYYDEKIGKTKKRIYNYPELNGNLETLSRLLREYYKENIMQKLFEYNLIK